MARIQTRQPKIKDSGLPPVKNPWDYTQEGLSDELAKLADVPMAKVPEQVTPELTIPEVELSSDELFNSVENAQLGKIAANYAIARGVSPSSKWLWTLTGEGVESVKLDSGYEWDNGGTDSFNDDIFISPEGIKYTYNEFLQVASESDDVNLLEDAAGLTGESTTEQQAYTNAMIGLKELFPEQSPVETYNYFFEAKDPNKVQEFVTTIQQVGENDTTVSLLKGLGFSQEDINYIYRPYLSDFKDQIASALPTQSKNGADWLIEYLGDDWEEGLRRLLIFEGQNVNTEALIRSVYGEVDDQQITDYFSNKQLAIEKKAAEGGQGIFGNFVAGVGDIVTSLGGIAKWAGADGIGEFLTDSGTYMQVQAEPIPDSLQEFSWDDLLNPQFYATYGVRMIPSLMSLAIPGLGAYGLAGSVAAKLGIGAFGRAIITGIGGAVLSRPIESAIEAGSAYDTAISSGMSEEEASQAAGETFKNNLTLAGMDAIQLAAAFMPTSFTRGAAKAISKGWVTTGKIAGKLVFTGLSEGGEEVYQEIIQKKALGQEIDLSDPNYQLVFALGAIAGIGMGGGADIITRIQKKTVEALNPEQKTQFEGIKADYVADGQKDNIATQSALNDMVEAYPELEQVVEKNTKIVEKEVEFEQVKPKNEAEKVRFEQAKEEQIAKIESEAIERVDSGQAGTQTIPDGITKNMPDSYVQSKKRADGKWQLFFTGTTNEVFPNELFSSSSEARMAFKVAKAKLSEQPQMAKGTSVQSTMAGIEAPAQQSKMLGEFGTAGIAGEKQPLINVTPKTKQLPGQIEMPEAALPAEQREARISGIKNVLSTKGRTPQGERTKPELRLELAKLEAQKQIEEEPDYVEQYKQDIEDEIQARMAHYHGATKAVDWLKPYNTAQLDEMWKVYDKAVKEAGAGPGTPKWTEFFRTKEQSHDWIKKQLTNYIRKNVPMSERGKLLIQVRDAKTFDNLEDAIQKANKLSREYKTKQLKDEIQKAISKAKTKKNDSGIVTGKYGGEYQSEIDAVRKGLKADRNEVLDKIAANVEAYEKGEITGDEMYERNFKLRVQGIDGMTVDELQFTLDYIKSLMEVGRAIRLEVITEYKEKMAKENEAISRVISGGKEIISGMEREATGWVKTWESVENWQLSLTDFMDRLSGLDKSKPYESALSVAVDNRVHKSYNAEQDGLTEQHNKVKDNFYKIYGTRKDADANDILRKMGREKINLGTFKNLDGEQVTLELTKGQMIDIYNLLQATENLPTFTEGNRFTPEMIDAINNGLTSQDKQWANWTREYLSEYWESINAVYDPLYGVGLGRNENYWPRNRDVENSDIPEHILVKQDYEHFASVTNGSLKARTNNKIPFKFMDANTKLINHIQQMEHFKAWAFTIRDLRSIFMNKNVQSAIKQYHSKRVLKIANDYINLLARGGIEKSKKIAWLDTIRGNVAVSVLGVKPMIAIKQPTAILGFMTAMPYTDFVSGLAEFSLHPIESYKILYEKSSLLKSRYKSGQYERDLKVGVEGGAPKSISGKAGWKEFMLTLIQWGDKAGTVPGMWAKYKSALKEGKSDEDAIIEAEKLVNRTQNTSALHTMTPIQNGGSVFRLMTMFQDQPNKYFRLINMNMRNLVNGRVGKAKALTNIFIVWVIMPALFQFMSDGFRWREDRQIRAWLLGPINNLLIFGQMAQSAVGWITGENYNYEPSPVLQILDDAQLAISKAGKIFRQFEDPYSNISMDDVIAMIEYLAKAGGMATGVPTPFIIQVEKALRSGKPINLLYSEWALRDDSPDNETKAEDAIGQIGQEKEQTSAEKATGRQAEIYDINDLENALTSIYNKVLPSQIKTDNELVKSWADKEIVLDTVETLPDVALKDLIKYDSNGENIVDWYIQWQDRQKITNLADLKEFDKLNPNAYKGNISKRQYELVTSYMESDNRESYLSKNEELNDNLRGQYLKDNVKENALLALWEGEELYSYEAYTELKKLTETLDIPDNAIEWDLPTDESYSKYFEYVDKMATYGKSISSAKSSIHFSLSAVTEDKIKLFYLDMEYASLRKADGSADTKARDNFRRAHQDYNQYGIDNGWWKQLS